MTGEPRLRGREAPLEALRGALAEARGGRGRLALVTGEAGIGKTTLASAIASEAEASGARVTWGKAWEFAEAPPYFPVRPCLRALGIEPGGDAFALWEQVLEALARAPEPIVWIIEDLHAADLGTLDLLTFLSQPVLAMRVLVVATARERDPRVSERMLQRLARMARDGLELRLESLAAPDVAAIAADALGRALPAAALARLLELTGGNPLFVVECARAFRAGGDVTLGALPPTVRQVVLDRVSALPEAARDALGSGAILGREFAAASVARMASSLPARVIDALLPALRAGVVRETVPGQFAFSHTLVRDAIEDSLTASMRAHLHARAEAALASLGESSEIVVERARHALAASRPGSEAGTLALATRAAEVLEHDRAFDRAFELHGRIAAARDSGFLPPAEPAEQLHAARVARAAGRADVSRRLCEGVIVGARRAGDPELLARAALLAAADIRPGVVDRAQVALFEEARAALGDRAPALGARVLARLATALQPAPDPAIPRALARRAREEAVALGDPAAILDVLELGGWGVYNAPLLERVEWASELRDRARAAAALDQAQTGHMLLAFHRIEAGDFPAFEREVASMLAIGDELGHPRHRWRALLLASTRAATLGRAAESERYVSEVEQLAPLTDDPALGLALAVHRLMRALVVRRDDEVRAALGMLEPAFQSIPNGAVFAAILRGLCAARLGELDGARAALAVIRERMPLMQLALDPTIAYTAEIIAAVGTDAERRAARDALAEFGSTEVCGGALSFAYDGPIARYRGLVDAALGDLDAAIAQLGEALALARARDHAPWIAQIAGELARVLERAGRSADARVLADEAVRIARELGLHADPTSASAPLRIVRAGADRWELSRGATTITVKDSRGVQLLVRLIERPGEELHVLALASDDGTSAPESSAGEQLDARARTAYRRRLAELADALDDAENRGDTRRAAAITRERSALVAELARATGLGGKTRAAASTTERARSNVQKRLKDAIERVAEADPELGRFLERAVRTGVFCVFRP